MLHICYTVLSYLLQPVVLLMFYCLGIKQPEYRKRLKERYGFYGNSPNANAEGIVLHAASVGEVIAAMPLIKALQANYPNLSLTVTTFTPTGSARVKAAFGESVNHVYLPFDLPFAVKRFLKFVRPKLFIVIETELWPNLISQISRKNIPLVIANARLSARSAARYGKIKKHLQKMWNQISLILAQDTVSAQRYINLGVASQKLICCGNLKFDISVNEALREKITQTKQQLGIENRLIWIAGSTHEGEEQLILEAHQSLLERYPNLLLLLVPRHPERFAMVEDLIKSFGLRYHKRSENPIFLQNTEVFLGDTMGEMMLLYGLSNIAFVGGSLIKRGGHNPLEPIAFTLPVISGKHTFNFPEIFTKLREVEGFIEVESSKAALVDAVSMLLQTPQTAEKISQAGYQVLKQNKGALVRHLQQISRYLEA